ncbi:SERTA domain-containing protein 2-like isoform X2 [Ambystoma mexicanum]
MMPLKGTKRKLSDLQDAVSGDPVPHSLDGGSGLRQSLLNMSLDKFNTGRMLVEPSLRRSVLIANTLRVLQEEIRIDNCRPSLVTDLPAPTCLAGQPVALGAEAPSHLSMHTHSHGVTEDLDGMFFSEDDFSLTSAISSILKDLEVVLDDGAPVSNHSRLCVFQDVEKKHDVCPSKCSIHSPLPSTAYTDENRVGDPKRLLAFDSSLSHPVEEMDIELVGELILGAQYCQEHPLDCTESRSLLPKTDAAPVQSLQKDLSSRILESKSLDSIFGNFELMSSSYLKDLPLDDRFLDIDTSVFEREPAQMAPTSGRLPFYPADDLPTFASSCNSASFASSQPTRDLNELDNIMEILVGS